MSLDLLSEMIESYDDGDLDLVEELYTEGAEELIERDTYHGPNGKFATAANATSLSQGDNDTKFKMRRGKKGKEVKVCGRLARRSRTNKLCATGKFPDYYKGGRGRKGGAGARARGAGPAAGAPAKPAKQTRKRVLRRKNASAANRALRSRGHDLGAKSDKSMRRAVSKLVKGLNAARTEGAKDKFRAALDVLQPEFEKRGMPDFIERSSKIMATRIQSGATRLRKAPIRKEKEPEVTAEGYGYDDDYDMFEESLEDDAVDMLADIFDGDDEE